MSVVVVGTRTAIIPGMTASFLANSGTGPYTYSVLPGGAGGTINASNGNYTAPDTVDAEDPTKLYDTIQAEDSLSAVGTAQILVAPPLFLFCEIIEKEMGLAPGRVYLWDQKINQPQDKDLYVAVSVMSCKPFGNVVKTEPILGGMQEVQSVSMQALLSIDAISRGVSARDRKEEILLALNSLYSETQQEANSFFIGKISKSFINISEVDGAAIPYRFRITANMLYTVTKKKPAQYFDTFEDVELVEEP